MKVLFISVTLAVVYLIRYKRIIRVTYDKDRDTFRSELLIAVSTVCALLVHERIKGAGYFHFVMEVRTPAV
jgi:ER lumen protein retaining receptor